MPVQYIKLKDKEVILLGTAHVSRQSVAEVRKIIESERPDCIALELDSARFAQLVEEQKWRETDIISIIKTGRAYLFLFNLILASMQRKIGKELGVKPGSEMLAAAELAAKYKIPIALVDRDISITMKRAFSRMGFFEKLKLFFELMLYSFGLGESLTREKIEELKREDMLSAVIKELSKQFPSIKEVLIDERDQYIAGAISKIKAKKVLAVVGAGHIAGIKENLGKKIDLSNLKKIPKTRGYKSILKFILPLTLLLLIAVGVYVKGTTFVLKAFFVWFLLTSSISAIGAILARAHWKSVLTAFFAAPITTLHPALASGWFAGIVEATVRPPTVKDFEEIPNMESLGEINKNRFTHIIVVTAVVNLASTIATFLSLFIIATML